MLDHRADQRFDLLVLDEADLHPPRVLQARCEEVHPPLSPIEVRHVHVTEVVLRELAGETLEPDHRPRLFGP